MCKAGIRIGRIGGVKVRSMKKVKGRMIIPIAIICALIGGVVGFGIGWSPISPEVWSLEQEITGLRENLVELQGNFDDIQQDYNALNTDYGELQQRYVELEGDLKPSFPSGSTYNQVVAWDCLLGRLYEADGLLGNDYIDGYITFLHYDVGHEYIRGLMLKLIGGMDVIRQGATSEWDAPIDKYIEVAEWSIRGIDNYALHLETEMESYYNLYEICLQNAVSAEEEAWNLMPNGWPGGES